MEIKINQFIRILSDFIHCRESSGELSEELVTAAILHNVEGIFYYQTKAIELKRAYYFTYYSYINRQNLEKEIKQLLVSSEIPFFFVKGLCVAKYYPVPELRTMGDSDLVVKDRVATKAALIECGYEFIENENYEWHFSKSGIQFELHNTLLYGDWLNTEKHINFFNTCWDYVQENQLNWNFHFLFLIEHLHKHFLREGVGIRQFVDIAILITYAYEIFDWEWIKAQLISLELMAFSEKVFYLIHEWFEIELPFNIEKMDDQFYEEATKTIFDNGVFGYSNQDKYVLHGKKIIGSNTSSYNITMLKLRFSRYFPSYTEMITWPQYKILKGKKCLLPFFWIYRLLRNIFLKDKWVKIDNETYISEELFNKYNEELKKWGL